MSAVFPPPLQRLPKQYYWKYADAQAKHFGSPLAKRSALYRLPVTALYSLGLRFHQSELFHYPTRVSPGAMIRIAEVKPLVKRPSPVLSRWQGMFTALLVVAFGLRLVHGLTSGSDFDVAVCLVGLYAALELLPKALRNLRYGDGTRMARWHAGQAGMTVPLVYPSGLIGSGQATLGLMKRMIDWVEGEGLCVVTEAASPRIAQQYKKFGLRTGSGAGLGLFGPCFPSVSGTASQRGPKS